MKPILCLKQICTHIFVYAEARNNELHISGSFIFIKMHLIQLNKVKGLISFLIINDLLDSINLKLEHKNDPSVFIKLLVSELV